MRFLSTSFPSRFRLPSISFSGAGFLGVYHAGVYACLLKHGYLLKPLERVEEDSKPPILTGVSAGALISASISAGVSPDDAMNVVLTVAQRTKDKGGILDVLSPGFSLIDQLEDLFVLEMQKALGGSANSPGDYDNELLLNRIRNGELLHIGLCDRRKVDFSMVKRDLNSYVYADQYRNIKDITSACILSSYIPVGTGPLLGESDTKNLAVKRAWKGVKEMEELGFLKHGITGFPVGDKPTNGDNASKLSQEGDDISDDKLRYMDGGLVNMFPVIDDSTVIVAPVNGMYSNPSVAPNVLSIENNASDFRSKALELIQQLKFPTHVEISDRVHIGANAQNLVSLYLMARSSSPEVLDEKFRDGYDDAERFLDDNNLLTVFTRGAK